MMEKSCPPEPAHDIASSVHHPNPEMKELLPFIRAAGRFSLLTPAQERGKDLTGSEVPPEETI